MTRGFTPAAMSWVVWVWRSPWKEMYVTTRAWTILPNCLEMLSGWCGVPVNGGAQRHCVSPLSYSVGIDPVAPATEQSEQRTLKFYAPDDELPAAGKEALSRRSEDELRRAAERANLH